MASRMRVRMTYTFFEFRHTSSGDRVVEQVVLRRRESTDLKDMVHPGQGRDSLSILDSLGSTGISLNDSGSW